MRLALMLGSLVGATAARGADAGADQPTKLLIQLVDEANMAPLEGSVTVSDRSGGVRPAVRISEGLYETTTTSHTSVRIGGRAKGHFETTKDFGVGENPAHLILDLPRVEQLYLRLQAQDGTPLHDATITLVDPSGIRLGLDRPFEPPHSFDSQGRHVLGDIAKGKYLLRASSPGYLATEVSCEVPRTTELVVKLVATAAIDAEVLAPEGTPSDRAFVKAVPVPGGERIGEYTGASGKARLEKLKPGAWRVWAEDADGRSSESVVVQVQVGKPAVARLKLRP